MGYQQNRGGTKMKNFVAKLFSWPWQGFMTAEERYLSQSTDLADLERRQKQLRYGTTNPNLSGWV